MTNRTNPRSGDKRRTEHGPRWETPNPGKGCNSTHVARARRGWRNINRRKKRRQAKERMMESKKTDFEELAPPPTLKDGIMELASLCYSTLQEMLSPGVHPSDRWVHARTEQEQKDCLRYASAVIVYQMGDKIPPAPDCLKQWAEDAVPRVVLVHPEGTNTMGEQAEGVLANLHDRLDQWFRRVAQGCGTLEDGDGPYPKFSAELHFCGYDEKNDGPLLGAAIVETITETI